MKDSFHEFFIIRKICILGLNSAFKNLVAYLALHQVYFFLAVSGEFFSKIAKRVVFAPFNKFSFGPIAGVVIFIYKNRAFEVPNYICQRVISASSLLANVNSKIIVFADK